jgi:hypothetical protein
MLIGWFQIPKLLRVGRKTNADRRVADGKLMRSRDEIARGVARQEELRLALLRDYARTLGY